MPYLPPTTAHHYRLSAAELARLDRLEDSGLKLEVAGNVAVIGNTTVIEQNVNYRVLNVASDDYGYLLDDIAGLDRTGYKTAFYGYVCSEEHCTFIAFHDG